MSRIILALIAASVAGIAAPAAHRPVMDDEAKIAKQLKGLVPGRPQACINPSPSQSGSHYGNVVLVRDRAGILYRSNFAGGCTADERDGLVSFRPTTQLCSGDIVEIRDFAAGISKGSCSYNEFVPYRRPR